MLHIKKVPLGSDPNGTFFKLFRFYAHIIKLIAKFTANYVF